MFCTHAAPHRLPASRGRAPLNGEPEPSKQTTTMACPIPGRTADPNTIYLLTGPVRSGKTTRLLHWARNAGHVDGLLCPDSDGRRHAYALATRIRFPLQVLDGTQQTGDSLRIGRFVFSRAAFSRAQQLLLASWRSQPNYLVIDEVGPLELAGDGLEPALTRIIAAYRDQPSAGRLLLVVRDRLLDEVIGQYGLRGKCLVIDKPDRLDGGQRRP